MSVIDNSKRFLDEDGLKTLWGCIYDKYVTRNQGHLVNPKIENAKSISADSIVINYDDDNNNTTSKKQYNVWHKGNLRRKVNHTITNVNNTITLTPNCFDIINGSVGALTVNYGSNETDIAEYNLQFTVHNETHTNNVVSSDKFKFPTDMHWAFNSGNSNEPIWINDTSYQINILNDIASYKMFRIPDPSKRIYYSLKTLVFDDPSQSNDNALKLPYISKSNAGYEISPGSLIGDDSNTFSLDECNYSIGRSLGKEGVIAFNAQITNISNNAFNADDGTKYALIDSNYYPINKYNLNDKVDYNQFKNIKSIILSDTVTSIGEQAFKSCTALETIYIPDGVNEVGVDAFYGCKNLEKFDRGNDNYSHILIIDTKDGNKTVVACAPVGIEAIGGIVEIPNGVTSIAPNAFKDCTTITSVTIPVGVTSIGYGAFSGCSSLTSVNIPNTVTTIGNDAFSGCSGELFINSNDVLEKNYTSKPKWLNDTGFTSLIIGDDVKTIGDRAFINCTSLTSVTIPNSVTSIGINAFYGSTGELIINSNNVLEKNYTYDTRPTNSGWLNGTKFTKLTIGDDVETIGDYAFYWHTTLTSITIGNNVKTIGEYAFYNCDFTSVIIPDSVEMIENYAFKSCNLTSLTIGNNVKTIGEAAFEDCDSLTSVTIPDSVTTIGREAFYGCSSLTSLTIGNSVTTIERYAFAYCSSLTSVNIPNNITTIGDYAFRACGLISLTIGNNVKTIGEYAFYNCSSLTSITIPDSVTEIKRYAFNNCTSLTSVTFNTKTNIITFRNYVFSNCTSLTSVTFTKDVDLSKFSTSSLSSMANISDIHIDCNIKTSVIDANNNRLCGISLSNVTLHIGENAQKTKYTNTSGGMMVITYRYSNTIAETAFNGCNIKNVILYNIHYSASNIKSAFNGCKGNKLTIKCNIPDTSNSSNALFYNSDFSTLEISNSVTSIGKHAFYNCDSLTSVTIGTGVKTIGDYAFEYCTSLTSVTIPDSVTTIGGSAFADCSSLTSVTIGSGVTSIGDTAFWGCGLTSVTIPNNVKTIEAFAFYICNSLTSVTIGSGVTSIGFSAFASCDSLTSVTIGNSVNYSDLTTIEDEAFYDCNKLKSLNCYALVPPTLGTNALANTNSNLSIKVPKSKESTYENAPNWSTYKSKISGISGI